MKKVTFKKLIASTLAALVCVGSFAGCGKTADNTNGSDAAPSNASSGETYTCLLYTSCQNPPDPGTAARSEHWKNRFFPPQLEPPEQPPQEPKQLRPFGGRQGAHRQRSVIGRYPPQLLQHRLGSLPGLPVMEKQEQR